MLKLSFDSLGTFTLVGDEAIADVTGGFTITTGPNGLPEITNGDNYPNSLCLGPNAFCGPDTICGEIV